MAVPSERGSPGLGICFGTSEEETNPQPELGGCGTEDQVMKVNVQPEGPGRAPTLPSSQPASLSPPNPEPPRLPRHQGVGLGAAGIPTTRRVWQEELKRHAGAAARQTGLPPRASQGSRVLHAAQLLPGQCRGTLHV